MALVLIRKIKYFLIALKEEIKSGFNRKTWWLMKHGLASLLILASSQETLLK